MNAESISRNHRLRVGLSILLAAVLLLMLGKSIREIAGINDFEVYHFAGELAAKQDPRLYELKSPEENRPFLYPPAAAILFIPLSWAPLLVSGVFFSLIKIVAVALLFLGTIRYSGADPGDRTWQLLLLAVTALIIFRPINNDFGNGQINILVAAFGAGGVWLIMAGERRWSWLGALCLAIAIALKLTPALLLAVPFLFRKWRDFALTVLFTALVMVALPIAWFGSEAMKPMMEAFNAESMESMMSAKDRARQISINELLLFTLAQAKADPNLIVEDEDDLYRIENGEKVRVRLPPPLSERPAKLVWLIEGLLVGALYLGGRWWLFRGRRFDWTWDLAVLCILTLLLSPLVRKAHLAILAIPTGWIVARSALLWRETGNWKAVWATHKALCAGLGAILLLNFLSEDLPIPVPGVFPMPYRPGLFLLCVVMLAVLAGFARNTASTDRLDLTQPKSE